MSSLDQAFVTFNMTIEICTIITFTLIDFNIYTLLTLTEGVVYLQNVAIKSVALCARLKPDGIGRSRAAMASELEKPPLAEKLRRSLEN